MLMVNQLAGFGAFSGEAAVGGNDANTLVLLHCDGTDASTTFTNSASGSSTTFTAQANAQIDTAQSVYGGASGLFDGTGDYLLGSAGTNWVFGTGGNPWTCDCRVRFNSLATSQAFFNQGGTSFAIGWLSNNLYLRFDNGSTEIHNAWTPSTGVWYHLAVVRDSSNNVYMFIDGVQIGTTQTLALNNGVNVLNIGHDSGAIYADLNGWMDEIRVSNVARWTTDFTPPTGPYTV